MEPIQLGNLTFEQKKDVDGEDVIVVRRDFDSETYAEFQRCKPDVQEWNYLKKNCWPVNGIGAKPPVGRWVLNEYIGVDQASGNMMPAKAEDGFTERELLQLTVAVNAAFGETDKPSLVIESKPKYKRRRRREDDNLDR